MAAALRSLAAIPARRHLAVLGVMAELGHHHDAEHGAVVALADDLGIDLIAYETGAYGLPTVTGLDGALATIGVLDDGDAVLVKGSRVAGLERLADALLES
jgi:UDP-N-acetylmuramoyl-tripeptide--D-alanyl-D-alanine ligase